MPKINFVSFVYLSFLVFVLIAVRGFENYLFYDPLLLFFKGSYFNEVLPALNFFKLNLNYLIRYLLNSTASLFILYVLFKDKKL